MKKIIWWTLLIVGIIIILYLLQKIGYQMFWGTVLKANFASLTVAFFVYVSTVLLRGIKWYWAAKKLGYRAGVFSFLSCYLPQAMLSAFTPFRSGDFTAPWFMDHGVNKKSFLSMILLDRVIELSLLLGVATMVGVYARDYWIPLIKFPLKLSIATTLIFIIGIMLQIALQIVIKPAIKKWIRNLQGIVETRTIVIFALLGCLAVAGDFSYVFYVVNAVVHIDIIHSCIAQIVSIIVSVLTFVPMGLGTGTISYSYVMSHYGYDEALLISGSLLSKIYMLGLMLFLGGGALLWRNRIRR